MRPGRGLADHHRAVARADDQLWGRRALRRAGDGFGRHVRPLRRLQAEVLEALRRPGQPDPEDVRGLPRRRAGRALPGGGAHLPHRPEGARRASLRGKRPAGEALAIRSIHASTVRTCS